MTHFKVSKPAKKIWSTAAIALVFLAATQLMILFFTSDFGNKIEQKKLDKELLTIIGEMNDFSNNYSAVAANYNFFNTTFINAANKLHFKTFCYQHDSLIAWSDNDYIIKEPIDTGNTHIYLAQNTYVIVKDYKLKHFYLRISFPLATEYKIHNQYLQNRLNPLLKIRKHLKINLSSKVGIPIKDDKNHILAFAQWTDSNILNNTETSLLFIFFSIALISLLVLIFNLINKYFINIYSSFILKILALVISLLVIYLLKWPALIFNCDIFNPIIFANSLIINSIGSLFLISIWALFLLVAVIDLLDKVNFNAIENPYYYTIIYSIYLLGLFVLLIFLKHIVSSLVFNSTISFDLTHILSLNYLSFIGLTILGIGSYAFYILFTKGLNKIETIYLGKEKPWPSVIIVGIISLLWVIFDTDDLASLLFFMGIIIIRVLFLYKKPFPKASLLTIYLLGFSILLSFWLNTFNIKNEHNKRMAIIQNLALDQDPQAEYLFGEINKKIYKDKYLLHQFQTTDIDFDSISHYIEKTYFRSYQHFNKYDFQITICTKDLSLIVRPQNIEILCDSFFYNNLIKYGVLTKNKNLYFLQYGTGQTNYLGLFRFYEMTPNGYLPYTIYVEINSKLKRKGFTRLLSEKEYDPFEKIVNYSLATYHNNKRIETYGNYAYPEHFSWPGDSSKDLKFITKNHFDHLVYQQDAHNTFVLSLKTPSSLSKLAPFSYIFILFGLLFFVIGIISEHPLLRISVKPSFSGRLQITMISIIIVSFAVISIITIIYIKALNSDKNRLQLENLAVSLQTEFEHKLGAETDLNLLNKDYLNSLLLKFSKVFDTDINLYATDGHLMATTRPEIFNYPLLADLMNPIAYNYLRNEHQGIYIAKENIGNLLYSSAYLPFHNAQGESIAYINLPYFAREQILKNEISGLLMTLMNVYTLIIVLSILVILIVSNYITHPLTMLKQRMQEVSMGKQIRKIEWQGIDEIKTLVDEYNRMIDALALSSEKLAKSERESAWREMAKQVAHEIKNPLTPMKLSVQYMLRSINEGDENNKERFESLSRTLIEQIDTLANIASAFSDFANMPNSNKKTQEINTIIESAIALFKENKNIEINFDNKQVFWVNIDKEQWLRVFNNLLKNSIQAVDESQKAKIGIRLFQRGDLLEISVSDNGKGISEAMKDKIFTPNFTTKTTGSGLGLAMVKNIVENSGGEIYFTSRKEGGTIFHLTIPISK